jgi:FHA domain-containing protein
MIRSFHPFQDETPMAASTGSRDRFLLWIDAVGGYWVTLSDEVVIGQPTADVDVPILGDISKRHARICRDGEGYLIEALRPVHVNGQPVQGRTTLSDRAIIRLGDRVELRFRRPHALSTTARLEFATGHRTQPSSDAVLLMGETCVLGPSGHSHVVCHNWPNEVVMFRRHGELFCRTTGSMEIDGVATRRRGLLTQNSRVQGDRFSFSLESI